jgi:hypothetical protein
MLDPQLPNRQQLQSAPHVEEGADAGSLGRRRVDMYDSGELFEDARVAEATSPLGRAPAVLVTISVWRALCLEIILILISALTSVYDC